MGCRSRVVVPFFGLNYIEATNPWVVQDWGSRLTRVGLAMRTLFMVGIPFLVTIMSTPWREKLIVAEGNTCNYFRPSWKPTFHAMVKKVLWTSSRVCVCSLPWVQLKRWIPIRSMGCVHTHWGRCIIEGCESQSHVRNIVEKIGEDNQKVGKLLEL
jgi:hypothetical protein